MDGAWTQSLFINLRQRSRSKLLSLRNDIIVLALLFWGSIQSYITQRFIQSGVWSTDVRQPENILVGELDVVIGLK